MVSGREERRTRGKEQREKEKGEGLGEKDKKSERGGDRRASGHLDGICKSEEGEVGGEDMEKERRVQKVMVFLRGMGIGKSEGRWLGLIYMLLAPLVIRVFSVPKDLSVPYKACGTTRDVRSGTFHKVPVYPIR